MEEGEYSPKLKDFLRKSLSIKAYDRFTVEEMLLHPWILEHIPEAQDRLNKCIRNSTHQYTSSKHDFKGQMKIDSQAVPESMPSAKRSRHRHASIIMPPPPTDDFQIDIPTTQDSDMIPSVHTAEESSSVIADIDDDQSSHTIVSISDEYHSGL